MPFLTYKRFYEQAAAAEFTDVLATNGIQFEFVEDSGNLDSIYGDKTFNKEYLVKIDNSDFEKADSMLLNLSAKELPSVDNDHYLFGFTDEELFDILSKPDEWNQFDYQLAKKILNQRGRDISQDAIDLLKKHRLQELAKPEEKQKSLIYAGYIFALLGGLIGVFIGWHLSTSRKTLPNGQQVWAYTPEDRRHGRRIWITGAVMFIIWMIAKFSDID